MALQFGLDIFKQQLSPFLRSARSRARMRWLAIVLLIPSSALCAITGPGKAVLFGHEVAIRSFAKHNGDEILETDVLTIDKKVLLKARQIHLWDSGTVAGTRVTVGMHTSGAMCDNNFFVLVFPDRGPPRIDATLSACAVHYAIEKDQVIFETFYSPPAAEDKTVRSRWIWTARGLSPEQHFNLKTGAAPRLLQSRSLQRLSELLEHSEFTEQIEQFAQASSLSEDALFASIKGSGSVRYEGGVMVAKACQADNCGLSSLLAVVDLTSNRLYLALKTSDAPVVVAPDRASWPSASAGELSQWLAQWQSKSEAGATK